MCRTLQFLPGRKFGQSSILCNRLGSKFEDFDALRRDPDRLNPAANMEKGLLQAAPEGSLKG
jgi:hypothetical protein